MKIKFNSDVGLPLNNMIEIPGMIIVFRAFFQENNKYYPQVFLDECLYKLWIIWKCYILIELMFLKELMLTLFKMGWGNFAPPAAFFLLWKIEVGLWPATIFQQTKFIFTCFLKIWAHFDPSIKSSQSFVIASWHVIFGWTNTRKIWL